MQPLVYAGDISPEKAWEMLETDPKAVLIDVRTPEEWAWVGVADLSRLGREVFYVPWSHFPKMSPNPDFVAQVKVAANPDVDAAILLLCRSGQRSAFAAHALTQEGFKHCYNVAYGFEGDKDPANHRGHKNGWKVAGLPWVQG